MRGAPSPAGPRERQTGPEPRGGPPFCRNMERRDSECKCFEGVRESRVVNGGGVVGSRAGTLRPLKFERDVLRKDTRDWGHLEGPPKPAGGGRGGASALKICDVRVPPPLPQPSRKYKLAILFHRVKMMSVLRPMHCMRRRTNFSGFVHFSRSHFQKKP